MVNDPLFFFEQTDFSLRFARCLISETSLNIEELKEVGLSDADALARLAPAGSQAVCALRPKPRQLHLATADEAKRHQGRVGMQRFAQLPAFAKAEPAWLAGVQASDGNPPGGIPWLVAMSSAAAQQQTRAMFESIGLRPARCVDATIATIGAVASAATGPTLLIEIGEFGSQAVLIGQEGVLATRAINLNLDGIAEAVQSGLNLKFRGSAAKLFLNPDCDFTDSASKIAARLASTLKAELAPLLAGQVAPATLCCAGLPALQRWLEIHLASALGLASFTPDIKAWGSSIGLTFANPAMEAAISPSWFNFLHFINSQTLESPGAVPWQADWLRIDTTLAKEPETISPPVPKVAAPPPRPVTAVPAATVKASVQPAPAPPAKAAPPASPAKGKTAAPPSSSKKPVATQPKTAEAAKAIPAAAPSKAPVSSVQYSTKSGTAATAPAVQKKSEGKNKAALLVLAGVLILALPGGGYFYFHSQQQEAARIALEQKAEQRIKAGEERARLAELKAREAAEERRKYEAETNKKLALAESARKKAEEEARTQAEFRLANARGTLVITTEPAGATVTVGNLPPKTSPATFNYIKIGKYPVTVALAHHEERKLELEITENNTTNPGVISLANMAGALAITSDPAGAAYEIRPANTFTVNPEAKRTGKTPATVDDLDPGEYTVTYSRPGWESHSETFSVTRNGTTQAAWKFPSGTLKINSSPSGATVSQNGVTLGVTPLTLSQAPGAGEYELKLSHHDTVNLAGTIEADKTLDLTASLPLADVIFGPDELDRNPEPIKPKTPDLPSSLTLVEGKVVIQLTVGRDGFPTDLKLIRASNPEIGRIYLEAVAKWKFKPGLKDGKPVRSAVVVPFLISPS